MNLVLLGPPGAGKGTQADVLSKRLGIPRISTGDILRTAVKTGTHIGLEARTYMAAGELVPDAIMHDIIIDCVNGPDCKDGFILDGAPRTIAQAKDLDVEGIEIDAVISIEVPDTDIQHRLEGRRTCLTCGASFHIRSNPPRKPGICDACGDALIIRNDDLPETVRNRIYTFHNQIEPLKGYYEAQGKLRSVDNVGITETTAEIFRLLGI